MKNCSNCDYSWKHNDALFCIWKKEMPHVREYESCDSWASRKSTNADRIRAMSDEELAAWIDDVTDCKGTDCPVNAAGLCNGVCSDSWLDWLKKEVDE